MASFNDFMSGMGKGIDEIAAEIAGSNYYKNIIPGKERLMKETNEFINNNAKVKARVKASEINDELPGSIERTAAFLNQLGEDVNINKEQATEIARVMHGTDYSDSSFEKLSEALQGSGISEENASKIVNSVKVTTNKILEKDASIKNASMLQKPATYVQAYFSNPNEKIKNQRIATAVGAYAGLTLGGRFLSGGTITTDSYGRKDIAGVPFV
jgi:hypothetical protein